MRGQIAFDMLIAFAISGAFAVLIVSISYGMSNSAHLQLSGLANDVASASAALNSSINPAQEFMIQQS